MGGSAVAALPFLPGSIPAAFMLWQAPMEAVVWVATQSLIADGDLKVENNYAVASPGAAATTIGLSVAHVDESFSLTPGERRIFRLPPEPDASEWIVFIQSRPGFGRFGPNRQHRRALLAAWIEIP